MTTTYLYTLLLALGLCGSVLAVVGSNEGENGGPCLPDAICIDDNAICLEDITCSCREGYVDVSGLCRRPDGFPGTDCQFHADCFDEHSFCMSGSCQCSGEFEPVESICVPIPTEGTSSLAATPTPTADTVTCQTIQCENDGSCVVDPNTGNDRCECPRGFAGPACQFDDPCPSNPCPPGADCRVNLAGERQCLCPPNVEDPQCFIAPPPTTTTTPTTTETTTPTTTSVDTTTPMSTSVDATTTPTTTTTPMTTTTTAYECSIVCLNGGTCIIDRNYGDYCDCPQGFTGQACESNIDYCINNPCPNGASCLSDASSTSGYKCICQGDVKGPNCDEADPLVSCQNFDKLLYLELQPTVPQRTICIPTAGGTPDDVCYDPYELLVFHTNFMDDSLIQIEELPNQYCVQYYPDDATLSKYCLSVTAYEADDQQIRPWRNANATICFIFNRRPEFIGPQELSFNLPTMNRVQVESISVVDPDVHQELSYAITEVQPVQYTDLFSVSTIGQLQIIKPATLPQDPLEIDVFITVEDNGIPSLNVSDVVKVKFTDKELLCTVNNEHIYVQLPVTGIPKEIGRISCLPENPAIRFALQADGDLSTFFKVSADGGIYLNQVLQEGDYQFIVQAEVLQPVRMFAQIDVSVKIGNWLPDCPSEVQPFNMSENAPTGRCLDSLYTCSNPSNKPFNCTDNGSELFTVECLPTLSERSNSIRLKVCSSTILKGRIGSHLVNLVLANIFGETEVELEIMVENVNDRPNIDREAEIVLTVQEDVSIGEIIANITVSDQDLQVLIDPPEALTAAITEPANEVENQAPYPFGVTLSPDQDYIILSVTQNLDVTVFQKYRFDVKVTDREGLSDMVPVRVIVEDVNEPPSCSPSTYNGIPVSVKDQPNKVIVALSCSDRDVDTQYKRLVYEIQGDTFITDHFAVNGSGAVKLRKQLTDITDESLTIIINVADGTGASVQVNITIDISSDFPPECSKPVISSSKSENTAANVCFSIDSGCIEPVNSRPLRFELISGNGIGLFRLQSNTEPSNSIGLCTNESLKNNYGDWTINGRAVSDFGATPITVVISVSDVNDPPRFEKSLYNASVLENSAPGYKIIQIKATDPDSKAYGQVSYISADIDSSDLFSLDQNDGSIKVKGLIDADEGGPVQYTFIVEAVDGGPPHDPVVTTEVEITIEDVNDNTPNCYNVEETVPLHLLTSKDETVFRLMCSDNDRSEEFRQLSFSIVSQTVTGMFSVDTDGVVKLEETLSRDVPQYEITVAVLDSNKVAIANRIEVDLIFVINNTVPARCTPGVITEKIPEIKEINYCIQPQVACVDITGGDTISMTSSSGNGTKYLDIRHRQERNVLLLSACIENDIKDSFGIYQIEAVVFNGLAETRVLWTFTVTNVNEPPSFSRSLYEATIPENVRAGTKPIVQLVVTDPDEGTPNRDFHISKVTAKSLNDAEFNGALSDYIKYFNASRDFYVVVNGLNATKRNEYSYEVTAEDGLGLKATSRVAIYITDVNENPKCNEARVQASTNILKAVGETIGGVVCFDTDLNAEYKALTYKIINGDPDGYFDITSEGFIIIGKKLPRRRLYTTGRAELTIKIEDSGEPPLSTTVTADLTVDNRIPPTCNPVIQSPRTWFQGKCLTITMGCSDPTMPESTGQIKYILTGNYTLGFEETNVTEDIFDVCYAITAGGFYEIIVDVDNGLSVYRFRKVVEFIYEKATPVFIQSLFSATVSEFTMENEEIITAYANSTKQYGELIYRVIGDESTVVWSDFFSMNSASGTFITKKALKDLADKTVRITVEVQDSESKLKSSALVEITVVDENEAPVCDITETDISMTVDTNVNDVIKQFSCSDPDVVADFKMLSYSLTGSTNVNIYFKLVPEEEPTFISLKAPLSVFAASYDSRVDNSRSSYFVTLDVRDNADPPKIYSKRLTIIVALLPPPVDWEILEVGYNHAFVSWKYARNDYIQVTKTFQVMLQEQNSNDFFNTDVLKFDKRIYNATGIKPETDYDVFISAVTDYGKRNTLVERIRTLAIPKITVITTSMKFVNIPYNDELRVAGSPLFVEVTKLIISGVEFSLKGSPGYVRTEPLRFRPGSVIAETTVYVNQSGNPETIENLLENSVSSGYLGELAVDSTYFYSSIDGGYVLAERIELGDDKIYSGRNLGIKCYITTAGFESDTNFRFWWTFNGNIIRPNSVSRMSTNSYAEADFPEIYLSNLQIKNVTPRDAGTYECHVTDFEETSASSKSIAVAVLSQPVVSIYPLSLTTVSGSAVTIVCTLVEPLGDSDNFQFVLYRNDSILQIQQGEQYSANDTTATLSIASLTVTTSFGCRGHNDAGEGSLVRSHIGVKPAGQAVISCPPSTVNRNEWPETMPGIIAVLPCPTNYKGEITRLCGDKGVWKPQRDNCVHDKITEIQQQVKDIKDGSGRASITDSMKGLINVTDDETLYQGDMETLIDTLDDTATATNATRQDSDTEEEQENELDSFLEVCDNILDERHKEPWDATIEHKGYGANEVSRVVDKYMEAKTEQLSAKINAPFEKIFFKKNIYAQIGREDDKSITFPNKSASPPLWANPSATEVYMDKETFKDRSAVVYDCIYYRHLPPFVMKKIKRSGKIEDFTGTLDINSEIIGANVQGKSSNLDPPVAISFKLTDKNYSNPECIYWDHSEKAWSTDGCYVDEAKSSDDIVTCKCNHLTNFAILMSPGKTPPADILALSIISAVGCGISMFCLLVTILVYVSLWRVVKSDRAVILLNLCVALIVALALFLGGVGRAENKDACTAISVLLHYIFLVVFFLMLAEGIDIAVTIMYVFATKSRIKWLLPLSWLIPAVIVAISAGVTKLEGYGNETFCWLSVESGLLWAFVGPAAFVILVNFIIIIIVFRQMFTTSAMLTKSDKEKAKTSLRSLCVLLPIMGLTWVFGVFSINESLVAFQYIFAILNSLQGFFIFLFHCFFNKQLRDAIKQRRARKKSLQSFEKSFKEQHSTGTGSTAYQVSEDKTKDINTDSVPVSSSTNPFLEADRQMKELVSKGKKTGNTFDKEANNKAKVDKDKPPVDVALEDVKISNILRESEVMSGTAGISSILTTQPDTNKRARDESERPSDDKNNLRESRASTHAYDYALDPSSGGIQKPAGYERLLPQQSRSTGYDRIVRSDDNMPAGLYGRGRDGGSHGKVRTDSRERIDENRDRSTTSSRSDEDYEVQVSQEVSASLPKKYDHKQTKKPEQQKKSKPKIAETGAVKKLSSKKKKEMEKDRSRLYQYQYPYEATYLGQQQSRHSSLENMSGYYVNPGYNPYAGMHPQGQTGRPTHQHQQWNPYGWGNQQRRDYW